MVVAACAYCNERLNFISGKVLARRVILIKSIFLGMFLRFFPKDICGGSQNRQATQLFGCKNEFIRRYLYSEKDRKSFRR